jgi:hypothetical protein
MELTILRTELDTSQQETRCLVWFQMETGETWVRVFPLEALEWRAAEYGIDPTDADTLLDVVLHEEYAEPSTLAEDPDTDTARERHLARIAEVKKTARFVEKPQSAAKGGKVATPPGLQLIKDAYNEFMDPAEVEEKVKQVSAMKAAHTSRTQKAQALSRNAPVYGRRKRPDRSPLPEPPSAPIDPTNRKEK